MPVGRSSSADKPTPVVVHVPRQGASAAAGESAREAVRSLGAQPVLLLVVILNMVFAGVAGWFFIKLEEYRHVERMQIMQLLGNRLGERP